ncbi:MAG TPA: ATP-binding protein [Burkholderiaceae bacterium]|nr:ATP-binding protein [Burkholderiaceae bacterium]
MTPPAAGALGGLRSEPSNGLPWRKFGRGDAGGAATARGSPQREAAGLFIVYAAAALLSIAVSRQPGTIASIWFANAVAMALLAQRERARWPLLLAVTALANAAANVGGGAGLGMALSFLPANLVEIVLGAVLLHAAGPTADALRTPGGLLRLLLLGGVLPQLAGASVGALTISWHGFAPFDGVWLPWFEGSVIGSMSVLPLAYLCWGLGVQSLRPSLLDRRLLVLVPLVLGVTLLMLAHVPFPFVYLSLVLVLAAMVVEIPAVALLTLLVSLTTAVALALGVFVPPPTRAAWEQVYVYLAYAAALMPAQLLAAAMAEARDGYARLATRSQELQHANEGLEQFVRMASHDLREPLNTVVQFGGLLEQDEAPRLSDPGRMYLGLMMKATVRMRALLDDVLHFARLRHGESAPPQVVALNAVLEEVSAALAASVRAREAVLEVAALPSVRGHANLLSLLFQNLLSNALKFVPPERQPRVRVWARVEGGMACITVADNGIGLTDDERARLFQPFQRLHPRRRYEGSGLGLSLAQQVAQQHGGSIRVSSVPGEGSSFEVRLPLA